MKIVEVITFLAGGGAERFVVDLSNELGKNNEVTILTLLDDTKDPEVRNFYRSEITENINYQNVGIPNGLSLSSQYKVLKALKDLNADIIHFHMIPTLKYSALAMAALAWSNKFYFSVHNDLHNGYDNGILKFICKTLGRIGKFNMSCLSEKNYQDFSAFYPKMQIRCIENGRADIIPTSQYENVKKELNGYRSSEDTRLYIHIARHHPVKNQKLLISAFDMLIRNGFDATLVIVGAGFDLIEADPLKKMACDRIHFVGLKKNVSDYILNADIFCLSSDYEGMPITLLEASLSGVPAVSTPVCGAVDIIRNGVNGYLSSDHSVKEYYQALEKSFNNYYTIRAQAEAMKYESPFTIEKCAKKYLEYFKD